MLGTIAIWIGIVSGIVIIAGGVIGAYRSFLRRQDLEPSWLEPQTGHAMESGQRVFKATTGLRITNRSNNADRYQDGEFDMRKPRRLRIGSGGSRDGIAFFVWIPGQPVIPPVSETSAWECRLTFWDLEQWAGQNIDGVVKVCTIRKTFSQLVRFTVPPIPESIE